MLKYLYPILLLALIAPVVTIDLSVYPEIIEGNENHKGEFQIYVSGMDEITQMTLQSGSEIIDVNFEKITISNCEILEFEKECIKSLIGCKWSSGKCSSATECNELSQSTCEKTKDVLKDKCEWDSKNNICFTKTIEIKSCGQITNESECTSSLFGCHWHNYECYSAYECEELSQTVCEKSTNSLKDKCEWDSKKGKCNTKIKNSEIKSCDGFTIESDCKSSLFGCQWSSGKCSSATECTQLSSTTCEKSTNSLKDKCGWDSKNNKCIIKSVEIKSCDGFTIESDCKSSLFGCQWSSGKCSSAIECSQLSSTVCENTISSLRNICEWDKENNSCKNRTLCEQFNDSTNCTNSDLGCQWYFEKCIDYFSCNQFGYPQCINTKGKFKDLCEWNTLYSKRYCLLKRNSSLYCNENTNEEQCKRSLLGCKWYRDECIEAEQCSELSDFSVCLNNTGILKDKCEYVTFYSQKYCRGKGESAEKCSDNLNSNDCLISLKGCKWYRDVCIEAEQCSELSDFSVCLNNTGILKDKCEYITFYSKKYCKDKSEISYKDNCKDITYDDCQKGVNGCYWISGKCILPTQCSDFNQTICTNIKSYSSFSDTCEWNESAKKCQRKGNLYGLCRENLDENDCSRSLLGCAWVNNKCVDAHHCSLLSSSACGQLMSNTLLRDECEWNGITNKCQRLGDLYGLCSDNVDENDCSRSLLGCTWVNNECIMAQHCNSLSSSACENLKSNTMLRGDCIWNKNDKICLKRNRLIRNLVEDEVTTKYYCSFNFPNIEKDKNYNLTLIDKNNNKTSISLSLIPSNSSIDENDDDNNFVIYKASDNFLKNNLLISLILILLFFMFNY